MNDTLEFTIDAGGTAVATQDTSVTTRAKALEARLKLLRCDIETQFLEICDLLLESQEGEYHLVWGFNDFGSWVEEGSGLDISARQAYYYLNISRCARKLGLDRAELVKIGMSKLKEIFTLDPAKYEQEIRTLLKLAEEGASLTLVKSRVREITAPGQAPAAYVTLKLDAEVKDTFDEAVELARRNYGSTIDAHGDVADISISKALELILVSYLQDPNNHAEPGGE